MVIHGSKMMYLEDKSVNNHPTQIVNHHCLDTCRAPTGKVRPNHTKRMGTKPIPTLFKRFYRNWFDVLMETWRSNAVLGVDTGTNGAL